MGSTNKTENYELNQFVGTDTMKREDWNNDNQKIDSAMKSIEQKADGIQDHITAAMPHKFTDGTTTYRYGWKVVNGELQFIYEEAL